jgi:hypothetical protein
MKFFVENMPYYALILVLVIYILHKKGIVP